MKEQIEEMAKLLRPLTLCYNCRSSLNNDCKRDGGCYTEYECPHDRDILTYCKALYNAGYRKQSENVIELPCAIGTTIYELIYEKEDPCSWCEHDHSGFGDYICDLDYDHYPEVKDFINGEKICPEFQMNIIDRTFDLCFYYYNKDWFNITWFLTKEEAENALAKMKGGVK